MVISMRRTSGCWMMGTDGAFLSKVLQEMPALDALAGVVQRVQVGGAGAGQRLGPDQEPGLVHHQEHGPHALVLLPEQGPPALALGSQRQRAGGVAVDAHLLFDPGADHVVRLAQAAVVVHPDLGHDEEGDPGGARRRAFDAGQHRVNDVLGQVVFARGDKDLVAGDGVGAVRVPDGGRGEGAHVGAGLRLGQEHGAGPVAGVHVFEEKALLLVGAEAFNQFAGAVGEAGVHDKGEVGPVQVIGGRQGDTARHALPAPLGVFGHRQPLAFL